MFEISVSTSFRAVHAVTIAGVEEQSHSHEWKVVAIVEGETLSHDGLLVDFLELQQQLDAIVSSLNNADLNSSKELEGVNPTAEHVAWYIATQLKENIQAPIKLASVQITEAPNCIATYRL